MHINLVFSCQVTNTDENREGKGFSLFYKQVKTFVNAIEVSLFSACCNMLLLSLRNVTGFGDICHYFTTIKYRKMHTASSMIKYLQNSETLFPMLCVFILRKHYNITSHETFKIY